MEVIPSAGTVTILQWVLFGDGAPRGAALLSLLQIVCVGVGWGGVITFFRLRFQDVATLQSTSKTLLIRCDIFFK